MALPTNADVIVVHGYWLDELTGVGVKQANGLPATIMFDPVPLLGANAAKTPNLRDLTSNAHLKTRTRVATVDPVTGYYATQLVASNDPDLDAYGGRKVTFLGEDPFTIEVPYSAPTVTVSAEMAAKTGLTQGSNVKAVWLPNASVTTTPTPTPPNNYLTSTQTLANIASGVEAHDEDPAAHADIRALIGTGGSYTDEQARDALAAALVAGAGITITVDDAANTITLTATGGSGGSYTDEQAQDALAALVAAGTHSGITFAYNDAGNAISATVSAQSWTQITGKPTFATVATSGAYTDLTGRPTFAAVATSGSYADLSSKPTVNATADYTGRYGTVGTGTDSRAAIQTALNAATDGGTGGGYYQYLTRRSTTVKLAPGNYVLTAPSSGPTLKVPIGVTLDLTDAALYFDYPSTARTDWCAIEMDQYAQLQLGKVYPSGRTSLPDSALVYDAVRLVQTDENSRVMGYADSDIRGWAGGAAIRGVGAWIVYIEGLRIADNAYGYIASNLPATNAFGYTQTPPPGVGFRAHTDLRMVDCFIVNCSHGSFVGAVQGAVGAVNSPDYTYLSLTAGFIGCIFQQSGAPTALTSAMTVTFVDCAFEDTGVSGGAAVSLDNCYAVTATGSRVNQGANSVPGPSGTVTSAPSYWFSLASVDYLIVDGAYVYNNANAGMQLVNALPRKGYRVAAVDAVQLGLAAGPLYPTAVAMSGTVDGGNSLFASGNVETVPRLVPLSEWAGVSGRLWLTYVTPPKSTTLSQMSVYTGSTATATATLARIALFLVNPDGSLTKVAQTASDTTIGASTYGENQRAMNTAGGFPSSYNVIAGQRYAFGFLQVAATPMTVRGVQVNGAFSSPIVTSYVDSQTDIAASYTSASLNTWYQAPYFTAIQ